MNRRGFLVAVVLIAAAAGRHLVLNAKPLWAPDAVLSAFPRAMNDWTNGADVPLAQDVVAMLGADQYLNRNYRAADGPSINLYIGYYRIQRQGATIHSPLNCLPGAGWQPLKYERVPLGDGSGATVNRVLIQKGDSRQIVYYWYQSHERIIANEYLSKLHLVLDSITTRRGDTALVRVVMPVSSQDAGEQTAAARAREFAALAAASVRSTLFPQRSL